jgi:pimeloyl-ACP methyl ester carboxylesterase
MLLSDQADDAKALIDGLADGRALVFGSSGGAIVTLDLCARYPDSVIAAVAHEPPVFRLLPPQVEGADFYAQMAAMYREVGTEVMGMRFAGAMGDQGAFEWPEDLLQRFMGNVAYLFTQEWAEWEKFVPDFEALAAAGAPLLLAGAAANRGRFNSMPAVEMASRLGTAWLEFPGIHLEFLVRPQGFAAGLRVLYGQLFTSREGIPAIWRQPPQA